MNLILSWAACNGLRIRSADSNAYFQGKPADRVILLKPPKGGIPGQEGSEHQIDSDTSDYIHPFQIACIGGKKCPRDSPHKQGKSPRKCLYWHPPETLSLNNMMKDHQIEGGGEQRGKKRNRNEIDTEVSKNFDVDEATNDLQQKTKKRSCLSR